MTTLSFSRSLRPFSAVLTLTALTLFAALLVAPLVQAQISGTLSGTVLDRSGAVVAGAKVTLLNRANQDTRDTISNGAGYFSFTGLLPATYTLRVEMTGFKRWERSEIALDAGDVRAVSDIKLDVGNTTEVVSVEAVAGEVAPEDSGERSAVITAKDIDRLPVEGRELSEFAQSAARRGK